LSDSIVLHNAAKEISDLDIEKIFNKDRNKIQSIINIGSIIRSGFSILNKTNEIYYGSSTTESTFTAPSDIIKSLQMNYVNNELSNIMDGTWTKPRTAEDYISM
jgi:hypothetical protein